ncbi:MAG: LCP family protein [Thermomicrobiales bacterium]|nr:LCP family protein [Thermomicrobiales bacterium]MCO5224828.1 LCP family protein [Thermomicrobiales bacterium]
MYQPTSAPRKNRWSRRKKTALVIVLLMILAPIAAAGYYVWDVARTIEDVQSDSVVAFPTSDYRLGGVTESQTSTASGETGSSQSGTSDPTQSSSEDSEDPKPTAQPTRDNPGSLDIARGILGTGTGTNKVELNEAWPGRDYINILVLGIDTRETGGDQNADVIMIARLDFTTNEVRIVSLPRDLQVEVPDHGLHKINGAYNIGVTEDPDNEVAGVLMMRDTIEYNFGIPIDEFVLVDFDGFQQVIDAVGGITIDVPEKIVDDAYPTEDFGTRELIIEAGEQEMNGETALAYARTRHQDSDDKRRERQMLVLRALLDKAQTLNSVTRVSQIISATGDAILTSIDWKEQLALASLGLRLDQDKIVMKNLTDPLVTPGTAEDGAWIYVGDPVEIGKFIDDVLSGNHSPSDGA